MNINYTERILSGFKFTTDFVEGSYTIVCAFDSVKKDAYFTIPELKAGGAFSNLSKAGSIYQDFHAVISDSDLCYHFTEKLMEKLELFVYGKEGNLCCFQDLQT